MAALTHQKHDLRNQIAAQVREYYDLLMPDERRALIGDLAYEFGGRLSVPVLRDWLGKLQRRTAEKREEA